ncbi:hypothetical protein [Nitrososphaera sp. AFS]|uniref:hypothetical protein n=1 Tax=Nitrososphaera sp. AFS TaxID=2301191 RepID=UPI0013922909|nr:hypothetical protein [Nitrososphaera sp. AFS]NAL76918.1 hypothetical protein [Nitrososphaera sp. AFS]
MSEDPNFKINFQNKNVEPEYRVSSMPDMSILPADFVKAFIDGSSKLCTLVFFRRHIVAKEGKNEMQLGGINDEAFLQVKIPFGTIMGLALYVTQHFKEMQNPAWVEANFGPMSITQTQTPQPK